MQFPFTRQASKEFLFEKASSIKSSFSEGSSKIRDSANTATTGIFSGFSSKIDQMSQRLSDNEFDMKSPGRSPTSPTPQQAQYQQQRMSPQRQPMSQQQSNSQPQPPIQQQQNPQYQPQQQVQQKPQPPQQPIPQPRRRLSSERTPSESTTPPSTPPAKPKQRPQKPPAPNFRQMSVGSNGNVGQSDSQNRTEKRVPKSAVSFDAPSYTPPDKERRENRYTKQYGTKDSSYSNKYADTTDPKTSHTYAETKKSEHTYPKKKKVPTATLR